MPCICLHSFVLGQISDPEMMVSGTKLSQSEKELILSHPGTVLRGSPMNHMSSDLILYHMAPQFLDFSLMQHFFRGPFCPSLHLFMLLYSLQV